MSEVQERESNGRGEPSDEYSGDAGRPTLAQTFAELSSSLSEGVDLTTTLQRIVDIGVSVVPGAQEASISSIENRSTVKTIASTGELPLAVDQAQYNADTGPCLQTLYDESTIRLSDVHHETRWPTFVAAVQDLDVGSMLSVQIFVHDNDLGALNFMSSEIDAFTDDSEDIALLFAAHAGVAWAAVEQREHLKTAIDTRDLIGQAKGILMERFKVASDKAFELLMTASQRTNRKLYDVADELVRSGQFKS